MSANKNIINKRNFLLVDQEVLPEVFYKVIEAKRMLSSGKASSASEATKMADISRSAFYKYKDAVFLYNSKETMHIITIQATLKDNPGILSSVLLEFANAKANILTVNQNIPVDHMALVSISARTDHMTTSVKSFVNSLSEIDGVLNVDITVNSGIDFI